MKPDINQIYHGDCIEVMEYWDANSVDHCIADPPYNLSNRQGISWDIGNYVTVEEEWDKMSQEEYEGFTLQWISRVSKVVKTNGNIFVFGSYHNIHTVGYIAQRHNMKVINHIVWFKPNATPNITCRTLTASSEHILWLCNNSREEASGWTFNYDAAKAINGGIQMRDVWNINIISPSEKESFAGGHPTQKPEKLIARIIKIASNEGDVILDPFAGSGTTAAMCKKLNRNFIMIEKEKEYVDMIHKRLMIIEEDNKQLDLLLGTRERSDDNEKKTS